MSESQPLRIDIFVSSPTDLSAERKEIKRALESLDHDPAFAGKYQFRVFLWEDDAKLEDTSTYSWQEYINLFGQNLSTSHVVIGMLWGRLGLELTSFVNPITGRPYRSGTEYELATAWDARRQHGLPQVLFYQCARPLALPQGDSGAQAAERQRQAEMAREFVREMQDERMIPSPAVTFVDAADLAHRVRADLAQILPGVIARLEQGQQDVSTLPALPLDYVERAADTAPIAAAARSSRLTLLHGLPGQGKTVIARAVCDRIGGDFPDGLLWGTFGQDADRVRIQREWILQLHGDLAKARDAAGAHEELVRLLRDKRALLVIDDVWRASDAQQVIQGLPPTCHVLVTSRNASLLPGARTLELGPMSPADSVELLRRASRQRARDVALLTEIAQRLGHLPLALKIVGARLALYSWPEIQRRLASDQFSALDAGQRNVYLAMSASVRFLPEDQRERYRELMVFPEDEQLAEAAVVRLWAATAQLSPEGTRYLLSLFRSLSLIQADNTLHDLQRDYLAATASDEARQALQNTFIATYGEPMTWTRLPEDGYSWRRFAWHLARAGRVADLRRLLLNATYLVNKLARLRTAAVSADLRLLDSDPDIALLAGVIGLSSHILDDAPEELPNQITGRSTLLMERLHTWPAWVKPHFQLDSHTLDQAGSGLLRIMRHADRVTYAAFSPDGRSVISASHDHSMRIWNAQTGETRHTLRGPADSWFNGCALSPDGRWALGASSWPGCLAQIWDTQTGELAHALRGPELPLTACAFSPDSRWALTGYRDGSLRIWGVSSGSCLHTLTGHTDVVADCAFSPDGSLIASVSQDHSARLWDVATGALRHALGGFDVEATVCAFSPDGQLVLGGARDGALRLWDTRTGQTRHILSGHTAWVHACAFSLDGAQIITASSDGTARLWDTRSGACRHTLGGHTLSADSCAFSPDGQWAVTGSWDAKLRVWDTRTGEIRRMLSGHAERINACAFSPDGSVIVSASDDHTLRLWDIRVTASAATSETRGAARVCAFSPDGRLALTGSAHREGTGQRNTLRLWDVRTGETLRTLAGDMSLIEGCAFSPDGRSVLAAGWGARSEDGDRKTFQLFDTQTGAIMRTFSGHGADFGAGANACAFSPGGAYVLSGTEDKAVRIWDARTGTVRQTFGRSDSRLVSCAFSPDGRWVFYSTGWRDNAAWLWDTATGAARHNLSMDGAPITCCVFSPDAPYVFGGGLDGRIYLWDMDTGKLRHLFTGHGGKLTALAFSGNGRWLLSASEDATLRLWDMVSGKETVRWTCDNPILAAAISPVDQRILAVDGERAHLLTVMGVSFAE